jgi:hypothetical protein
MEASLDHLTSHFEAAVASYPFGSGKGCYAIGGISRMHEQCELFLQIVLLWVAYVIPYSCYTE